jgi:hypothetical protein
VLSALFNEENGLIRFLDKAGSNKDNGVCSAVSTILGFLVEYIPKRRKNLPTFQLHALDLKVGLNMIYKIIQQINLNYLIYRINVLIYQRAETQSLVVPQWIY